MNYEPNFMYKTIAMVACALTAGALAVLTVADHGGVCKQLLDLVNSDESSNPIGFC